MTDRASHRVGEVSETPRPVWVKLREALVSTGSGLGRLASEGVEGPGPVSAAHQVVRALPAKVGQEEQTMIFSC